MYAGTGIESGPDAGFYTAEDRGVFDDPPCTLGIEWTKQAVADYHHVPHRWWHEVLWASHNLIAHPVCEIAHWLGFIVPPLRDAGLWLHDITIPPHTPNTGRG